MSEHTTIGVLAYQGDIREHRRILDSLGVRSLEVRTLADLDRVDGLIVPGGESTVIGKLTERYGLLEPLRERARAGLPMLGTCAGMIFMAREVEGPPQQLLKVLDVRVRRNAFGPQVASFEAEVEVKGIDGGPISAAFIRAPWASDAGPGKLFAKLIRGIEVAARTSGASPEGNPTLADAVQKAKDNSVPNDTIERAIKRGSGELGGQQLELVTYEGYGPGGVAMLIEALTDNRNRTASAVRHAFAKAGGNMAEAGSVAYLFNRKGQIVIPAEGVDEDRVMEVALEAGAEDVESGEDGFVVTTAPGDLREVRAAFERAGIAYQSAEVTMVPTVSVPLDREGAVKVLRLLDAIEDLDDTQDVYANLDIPAEVMAELA